MRAKRIQNALRSDRLLLRMSLQGKSTAWTTAVELTTPAKLQPELLGDWDVRIHHITQALKAAVSTFGFELVAMR